MISVNRVEINSWNKFKVNDRNRTDNMQRQTIPANKVKEIVLAACIWNKGDYLDHLNGY